MIPVTADHLEQLAFDSGATIELHRTRAYLRLDGCTYAVVLPPPPAPTSAEGRRP